MNNEAENFGFDEEFESVTHKEVQEFFCKVFKEIFKSFNEPPALYEMHKAAILENGGTPEDVEEYDELLRIGQIQTLKKYLAKELHPDTGKFMMVDYDPNWKEYTYYEAPSIAHSYCQTYDNSILYFQALLALRKVEGHKDIKEAIEEVLRELIIADFADFAEYTFDREKP